MTSSEHKTWRNHFDHCDGSLKNKGTSKWSQMAYKLWILLQFLASAAFCFTRPAAGSWNEGGCNCTDL